FGFFLWGQILSSIDDDRDVPDLRLDTLHQLKAVHVGQPEIEHHAIELLAAQAFHRFVGRTDGDCLNVAVPDELDHALLCDFVVFTNEQALDFAAGKALEYSTDFA